MNCGKWRVMAVSFFKPPPFIYRIYTHCRIYSYSLACFQKFVIVTLYNLWLGCCRKEGRVCFYIQSTLHRVRLQCLIADCNIFIFSLRFVEKKSDKFTLARIEGMVGKGENSGFPLFLLSTGCLFLFHRVAESRYYVAEFLISIFVYELICSSCCYERRTFVYNIVLIRHTNCSYVA